MSHCKVPKDIGLERIGKFVQKLDRQHDKERFTGGESILITIAFLQADLKVPYFIL